MLTTSRWLLLSFRGLIIALAPAVQTMGQTAGLNLNNRKCCWVQYGNERLEYLSVWLSNNFEDFREMQVVKYAKYVGTMIGPDGHTHRKIFQRVLKINASTKIWLSDCATKKTKHCPYQDTLDPYRHLSKLLSKLKPMPYSVLLQDHTMLFPQTYQVLGPCAALVLT